MTNNKTQEPLDKKITYVLREVRKGHSNDLIKSENFESIDVSDVKSSLSNLKKRLKEEIHVLKMTQRFHKEGPRLYENEVFRIIDVIFELEIGKGLLEDNDD